MSQDIFVILSPPRSGSSFLCRLVNSAGIPSLILPGSQLQGPSEFNNHGYFEDVMLSLLNDQIIRARFGMEFSFLHPPEWKEPASNHLDDTYEYDLDLGSIEIPSNYSGRYDELLGSNWDVWGLSRMIPGQKWHRVFDKFRIRDTRNIRTAIHEISDFLSQWTSALVIKDPRLAFTLDLFCSNQEFRFKTITISRNIEMSTASIKSHYGPRMFTANKVDNFSWVSNHFNYQIRPQVSSVFFGRYTDWIAHQRTREATGISVTLENLLRGKDADVLETFLERQIDRSLLEPKSKR